MDFACRRRPCEQIDREWIPFARPRSTQTNRGVGFLSPPQQPARDRALSQRSTGIDAAVWPEAAHREEVADRTARGGIAVRNPNAEEPHAEPGGKTFRRMRPRSGTTIGENQATRSSYWRKRDRLRIQLRSHQHIGRDHAGEGRPADVSSWPITSFAALQRSGRGYEAARRN